MRDLSIDVGEFFENIDRSATIWERLFNMTEKLNTEYIKEYHAKNLALFKDACGRDYHEYDNDEDFFNDLRKYVIKCCPGVEDI
jgi:hypothetical protein